MYMQSGGGWMICYSSNILVHFVFCQLNFIVLFPFLIKYYHILFIIIVFRLGCDQLISCFFYRLCQGISQEMWLLAWGRVDDFSFSIIKVHFFLLIEIYYAFSISYIVLTVMFIINVFDGVLTCSSPVSSHHVYCSLPRDQSRDVTPSLGVSIN